MSEKEDYLKIIKASKGWQFISMKELFQNRTLAYMLFLRDIKARYKQTALGPLWIIITPLMSTVVYTILFGKVANFEEGMTYPYAVFTFVGLIFWQFFTRTVSNISNSVRNEIGLMTKVYFPRLIPAMSQILSSIIDFAVSLIVLALLLVIYGIVPSWHIVFLPFVLFVVLFASVAIGIWFAGPTVKYRDISNGIALFLSFLQFLSPVVYPAERIKASFLPPSLWSYYDLNPFTIFIDLGRWCILGSDFKMGYHILLSYGILFVLLILGLFYFKKWESKVVDIQ